MCSSRGTLPPAIEEEATEAACDIAALYGPSGVGKTLAAIDLGYHVALGQPWQGRRVRQAPVLYVGLEGIRGLRHRMVAYRRHMGPAGKMLARLTIHTPLDKSEVGAGGEAMIIEHAKLLGCRHPRGTAHHRHASSVGGAMGKPTIVTSSWFTDLPPEFCRIGISREVRQPSMAPVTFIWA